MASDTFVLYDRAGIGTTYGVRMKLGHELLNFSEAAYLPRRDNDSLAILPFRSWQALAAMSLRDRVRTKTRPPIIKRQ